MSVTASSVELRVEAGARFFGEHAESLARLCQAMAERFAGGGRLLGLGAGPGPRSDARHVAVEFVPPVIVGKRALPALAIVEEGGALAAQTRLLVSRQDIALAFGTAPALGEAVRMARSAGALTVAFAQRTGAEHEFVPGSGDANVDQELVETLYHVLWELVHVFLDHTSRAGTGGGASSFLYPFLDEREVSLEPLVDDVRRSILMKASEIGDLRVQTLGENATRLAAAAGVLREALARGGKLLALGNGGSATDAMDVVADFGDVYPAIDLTADPGILTAITNDVGVEAVFLRQVIAYGAPGDVLVALSTSGNSGNVIAALEQARRQRLSTVALVGYDGGRVLAEELADHVIVTRSEHIPRIQEAQASAYHVLRELVG